MYTLSLYSTFFRGINQSICIVYVSVLRVPWDCDRRFKCWLLEHYCIRRTSLLLFVSSSPCGRCDVCCGIHARCRERVMMRKSLLPSFELMTSASRNHIRVSDIFIQYRITNRCARCVNELSILHVKLHVSQCSGCSVLGIESVLFTM
jgi:hypothetical protein